MTDLLALIAAGGGENNTMSWVMMCAAIVMATVVIMNMRRNRRSAEGTSKRRHSEVDPATAESVAIKHSLEQLLVELEELSRNIQGQIDTKFAKLEQSVMDADRRISALRILIDEAKHVRGDSAQFCERPDRAGSTSEPLAGVETSRLPGRGLSATSPDARHQRIYDLADGGMTAVQIAREIGATTGEIELILNLRETGG